MKIGDLASVDGIPDGLPPDADGLETAALFEKCVGRSFPIVGFNEFGHVELEVGEVIGKEPYLVSIWLEPDLLSVVKER